MAILEQQTSLSFLISVISPPPPPSLTSECSTPLQVAGRLGLTADDVKNVIIWGNHSSTQFPDVAHGYVLQDGKKTSIRDAIKNDAWLQDEFITVYPVMIDRSLQQSYNKFFLVSNRRSRSVVQQ